MIEAKIVFTGPPNAGKTTAIGMLSDRPPVVTDVLNHDASLSKERTTVGLDYGVLTLEGGEQVRLFGTPGQKRFDFMWKILVKRAIGVVILLDNSQAQSMNQLAEILDTLHDSLAGSACVVGVGRTEQWPEPGVAQYEEMLAARGLLFPVVEADVRQRSDVMMLIDLLLAQAEAREMLEAGQ